MLAGMEYAAEIATTNVLKVLLALTTLALLVLFYIRWHFFKARLNTIEFYTRSRFVRNSIGLGLGIICLSAAFILDAGMNLGRFQGNAFELAKSALEVLALVLFGYWFYALSKEKA